MPPASVEFSQEPRQAKCGWPAGAEWGHLRQSQRIALARCAQGLQPAQACPEPAEGTLYNRWKRWGEMDVVLRMMEGLAAEAAEAQL